ncbi:gp45 sliding clamp protein [Delftia phage PhiW-14]|uniref:Sliding clamp n=1 Tax=Delftia phage PhiW-14 TaxID=665032 RepID=C9DGI5_BPW14|nr:DNA polymerase processivity factor [Delftia phage PhiW-14]ACV50236.1 gp45 sliding clamp protein [Delftia phage PhiW-14]
MQKIALSKETRAALATAALVNNSIRIGRGNRILSMSPTQSVILEAEIPDTFPEEFSIYELNRFLQVLSQMEGAELGFNNSDHVMITSGRTSVKYMFANSEFVTHPGNQIALPTEELRCRLTGEDLAQITRLARVFGHNNLAFQAKGGVVHMITTTPELGNAASDNSILIEGAEVTQDGFYRLQLQHLVMPSGDYDLAISAAGITSFKRVDGKLNLFVGIEKDVV